MRILKSIFSIVLVIGIIAFLKVNFFSGEYSLTADISSIFRKKDVVAETMSDKSVDVTATEYNTEEVGNIPEDAVKVTFINVIDGDTLYLLNGAGYFKCRLIGIDTPESVARDEYLERTGKENTQEGKTASEFAKEFFSAYGGAGTNIYLVYDVQSKDKYGRDLAYVFLNDGRMLQDILLSEGLARTMTVAPNVAYAEHFREVQSVAQQSKKGFWSGDFWADAN